MAGLYEVGRRIDNDKIPVVVCVRNTEEIGEDRVPACPNLERDYTRVGDVDDKRLRDRAAVERRAVRAGRYERHGLVVGGDAERGLRDGHLDVPARRDAHYNVGDGSVDG